jgi:hypothetical protein
MENKSRHMPRPKGSKNCGGALLESPGINGGPPEAASPEGIKKLAGQRFVQIKADGDKWHHPSRGFV